MSPVSAPPRSFSSLLALHNIVPGVARADDAPSPVTTHRIVAESFAEACVAGADDAPSPVNPASGAETAASPTQDVSW